MKQLSPARRNQLIMVLLATAVAIGLVYFLLIQPQRQSNQQLANDIQAARTTLGQYQADIKQSTNVNDAAKATIQQLNDAEQDLATGDVNAWTYDLIRGFKTSYRTVEIPNIGQSSTASDSDLIPNFPYKQIKLKLMGVGHYHELGRFVADFENKYPHMRLVNLTMDPNASGEKLNFQMEVVTLVKPNS
jgi:Tfp pilus assembly protein PilO